jgi:putative addiction module component (TIGR02574 family)
MAIDLSKLLSLPAAERLELAEMLWQSVGYPAAIDTLPMPAWQQAELGRLLDEYDNDGDDGIPADGVMAGIRQELWPDG